MSDWAAHLLGLAARGELGRAGPRLWLDLPALAQPWTCASNLCVPGARAKDARSCCADLALEPTPEERAAIAADLPGIAEEMSGDPRWASPPAWLDGDVLARPGRRCVFALRTEDGLACGLHRREDRLNLPHGTLKPLPCRLFPLVLVDIEDGRTLLSAIHRRTATLAGSRPARAFPCLGLDGAPSLAAASADTLRALFGAKSTRAVLAAVEAFSAV